MFKSNKMRVMTTNYIDVAKAALEDATDVLDAIGAEYKGAKRPHVISDLHLEHRHHLKRGLVAGVIAIAEELERIGLAQ